VNDNLSAKYFVGLAVDQKAPDHSTLTVFRERLQQNGKLAVFEALLAEIVQIAVESGIQFGSIQIVDSVHSIANVNTQKTGYGRSMAKGRMIRMPAGVSSINAKSRRSTARKKNRRNILTGTKLTSA
jgi:hypothetical protein